MDEREFLKGLADYHQGMPIPLVLEHFHITREELTKIIEDFNGLLTISKNKMFLAPGLEKSLGGLGKNKASNKAIKTQLEQTSSPSDEESKVVIESRPKKHIPGPHPRQKPEPIDKEAVLDIIDDLGLEPYPADKLEPGGLVQRSQEHKINWAGGGAAKALRRLFTGLHAVSVRDEREVKRIINKDGSISGQKF